MTASVAERSNHKALHIALWVVQVLVGAAFIASGAMKLGMSPEDAAKHGADMSLALTRFIGASELAGGIGVILPALTRIQPWLTPLAAAMLVVVMILAVAFHIWKGDAAHAPPAFILGSLSAFIAWGRAKRVPIAPRA